MVPSLKQNCSLKKKKKKSKVTYDIFKGTSFCSSSWNNPRNWCSLAFQLMPNCNNKFNYNYSHHRCFKIKHIRMCIRKEKNYIKSKYPWPFYNLKLVTRTVRKITLYSLSEWLAIVEDQCTTKLYLNTRIIKDKLYALIQLFLMSRYLPTAWAIFYC